MKRKKCPIKKRENRAAKKEKREEGICTVIVFGKNIKRMFQKAASKKMFNINFFGKKSIIYLILRSKMLF